MKRMGFRAAIVAVSFWLGLVLPPAAADDQRPDLGAVTRSIIEQTNDFRQTEDRQAVQPDPRLTETAESFARFMARTGKYGHEADGRTPAERAKTHDYDYCLVSENIAYRYSSAGFTGRELSEGFMTGWKNSPEHRRNMLDPDVQETGVGVARASDGTYYAVQMFGRPESAKIVFDVSNRSGKTVTYTIQGRADREFQLPPRVTRTHTHCRPTELEFDVETGRETLPVEDGAQFVVASDDQGQTSVSRR